MRILLTGANGFIGSQIAAALQRAGHEVIAGVRQTRSNKADPNTLFINYATDTDVETWLTRLDNIDAVVNCVGILREGRRGKFTTIHRDAPVALFQACVEKGIRKVIQISAIGDPTETDFIASKHEADKALQAMDLDWTIIRPSVVYSLRGSYGGTSLIRALAAMPLMLFLPGNGQQPLQPVTGEDLGRIVVSVLNNAAASQQIIEAIGPAPVSFRDFLLALRRWLKIPEPVFTFHVALWLIKPVALLGQWFGHGPLGMTMYTMLQRGNVGSPGAYEKLKNMTGLETLSVQRACNRVPGFVQDRWHARLYFLLPMLRIFIGVLWVFSGMAGLVLPLEQGQAALQFLGIDGEAAVALIYGSSILDIMLGLMVLQGIYPRLALLLMLVSVLAYTLVLGIMMPALWWDPFGALIKNIPLVPALLILLATDETR